MQLRPNTYTTNSRASTSAFISALRELRELVTDAGGLDAAIEAAGGGNGFWDVEDPDVSAVAHYEDSRQASGLAKRVRDGQVSGIGDAAGGEGYFDATSLTDGTEHGAWAPDYSSDAYKSNKAGYKAADDKRAFCEENDIPVRELTGGYVLVRFIDFDSKHFDQEAYDEFTKGLSDEE